MKKILFFSSVCKPKSIVEISLNSYKNLQQEDFEIVFLFYNDNKETESSDYLVNFCEVNSNCILMDKIEIGNSDYQDHNWNSTRIDRIISIKNKAIEYAGKHNFDYLFLVDSDLVLNPSTLKHLVNAKEHFIFSVFWTLFFNEIIYKPNAWDYHSWAYKDSQTMLNLSEKGSYVVGGGGACTLISNEIMKKGLTFDRLLSLNYQGEDRHFCTRAQALGYNVVADSHFPAYHIFSDEQCSEAKEWYVSGANPDFFKKWLTSEWRSTVIKLFESKEETMFYKIKRFQYDVRRSFKKIFN